MNKVAGHLFAEFGAMLGRMEHIKLGFYAGRANKAQTRVLKDMMRINKNTEYGKRYNFKDVKTVDDYRRLVPMTTYDDYVEYIDRMINGDKKVLTNLWVTRYADSSGSVGKPKIIPLSARTQWVMQCFSFSAPVGCTFKYYKKQGKRIPPQKGLLTLEITSHKLPNGCTRSCLSGIPLMWLKPLVRFFATSPMEVMFPKEPEKMNMYYLKLRYALADRTVGYIGTMIITVLETMMEYLEDNWQLICDDIEKGTIDPSIEMPADVRAKLEKRLKPNPKRAAELRAEFEKGFDTPIIKRIWPNIGWLYGMGAGTITVYAEKLRKYIGDLPIHHMGYGASEAYMAVPIEFDSESFVMLPQNGFYEFLPVDAPEGTKTLTIDELKVGNEYEIILTNLSGLYRYRIGDVVRVNSFYKQSPMISFMYRLNEVVNIGGEKTSKAMLDFAVGKTAEHFGADFINYSVYADTDSSPAKYVIFAEPTHDIDTSLSAEYAKMFDKYLTEANFYMDTARSFGYVTDPEFHFLKQGTYLEWNEYKRSSGVNINQMKPVKVINSEEKKDFFFAHIQK